MKKKIRELLGEINPFIDVMDDTDLLEEGVLDSLAIMSLIMDIEAKFNIKIDMEKINIEDFRTVGKIEAMVEGLL